ncbi:1,2-dihydroxy-3-keto-5-methylthiopentene dioxygenase [Tanticharoenia sakaeratensis]|uniref:Acireductone dioxygenase n=1 Tax=Tanticharoenia sakaeratensis NBRC 103193 TaxID=1231623 RepID=A0A0D6MQK4_9PROT|nr:cupin domain-containing protein [Tanticharoenia sakaeratensis]GAN55553.1 dioxygenase [Tanticharoenia sakaeratensis NBRC 103193]GBQ21753.1 dioxygenase [Tanticharoenia sakaeratensis NBRC 103193]
MSRLTVYRDDAPGIATLDTDNPREIATTLQPHGIRFERWDGVAPPPYDASPEAVLDTYRPYLDALMGETGAGTADVVRINAATPNLGALRDKFRTEHTHTEDEVRFFVHGSGAFVLHIDGQVFSVMCTQGDLISVPTGTAHWFDAGPTPDVVALRVFTDTTGWVAHYTGDAIAERFPAAA